MKFNRKMCFIVVFLWVVALCAQAPDTLWTKVYGGDLEDYATSIKKTFDGAYVITGKAVSFGAGSGGMSLIKLDDNGDTLWAKTYGGEWGWDLQQTADSGFIITGYTWAAGSGDLHLVKTDKYGDTLWTRIIGGINQEAGRSVQQTSDGGYIIVGETTSFGAGNYDVYLVKTDADGDTLWTKTYGGTYAEGGWSVKQTSDKEYIIVGFTESFGVGTPTYSNLYFIKTDSLGDTLWTRIYGDSESDVGRSICLSEDGGYVIVGDSRSSGAGVEDLYLLKTDKDGDTLWTKTYGGTQREIGRSVAQTHDGGFIITGETRSFGADSTDAWIIRTDENGDTLWTKILGGVNQDRGFSVQQTPDSGFIVAGQTNSFGTNTPNYVNMYLIRLESEQVGVNEVHSLSHNISTTKLTLSPNPFSEYTTITINKELSAQSTALGIYDVRGRLVRFFNLQSPISNLKSTMTWDGTDSDGRKLPSGVYFIDLKSAVHEISQKVLLMR